jgi:CRISPR-associated protein Cmr6
VRRYIDDLLDELVYTLGRAKSLEEAWRSIEEAKNRLKLELIRRLAVELGCGGVAEASRLVDEAIDGFTSLGYIVVRVDAKLSSRGLVGVSSGLLQAALEVGLAWDHVLDVPVIPSTSVKGALRRTLLLSCVRLSTTVQRLRCVERVFELLGWVVGPPRDEVEQLARILGVEADRLRAVARRSGAGLLHVLDAYPVKCREGLLEPNVIAPHYHRGGEPVRDEYDAEPVPVQHVALRPGTVFAFAVAVDQDGVESLSELSRVLGKEASPTTVLAAALVSALGTGVGAWTSRGFSVFQPERVRVYRPQGG